MKQLLQYADQNRHVENRLLELLNMKGKHKHKYDFLRDVLSERIVFDDAVHRAWFTDDTYGLLFACKQAQVHMERPIGERALGREASSMRACTECKLGHALAPISSACGNGLMQNLPHPVSRSRWSMSPVSQGNCARANPA